MCRKGKKFGWLDSVQRPSMLYIGRTYTWTMCAGKERKSIGWSLQRRSAKRTIDVAIDQTHICEGKKRKLIGWCLASNQKTMRKEHCRSTSTPLRLGLSISNEDCYSNYDLQFSPVSSKSQCVIGQPDSQTVNPIVSSRGFVDVWENKVLRL
jgi:hypothetical protein